MLSVTTPCAEITSFQWSLQVFRWPLNLKAREARRLGTSQRTSLQNPSLKLWRRQGRRQRPGYWEMIIEESSKSYCYFIFVVFASFHPKNHLNHPSFCKSYLFFSAFVSGPMSCNYLHWMQGLRLHQCHQAPKRWQRPRQWSVKNRGGVSDHPKGLIQMDATYISNDTFRMKNVSYHQWYNVFNVFLWSEKLHRRPLKAPLKHESKQIFWGPSQLTRPTPWMTQWTWPMPWPWPTRCTWPTRWTWSGPWKQSFGMELRHLWIHKSESAFGWHLWQSLTPRLWAPMWRRIQVQGGRVIARENLPSCFCYSRSFLLFLLLSFWDVSFFSWGMIGDDR